MSTLGRIAFVIAALGAQPALGHHSALHFGGSAQQLLEPEQAFRFSARARAGAVEVQFAIANGYYMYRDKFRFAAEGNPEVRLGAPELPPAVRHKDEFFGETRIYRKALSVRIPAQGAGAFDLKVVSQGCADVGPPGIVFFDARGREIKGLRVIGYQDADRFLRMLESASSFSADTNG